MDGSPAGSGSRAAGRPPIEVRRKAGHPSRRSPRHQGHHRHPGHPHHHGLADLCRPRAGPIGGAGPACRGRRRLRAGKDRYHRIRLFYPGQDPQPLESGPHARRILERIGGGGRHGVSAGSGRHPDERLDDPTCGVLRRRGIQTDVGLHRAQRRAPLQPESGPAGRVHPQRRGRRLPGGSACGTGSRARSIF